MSEIIKMLDWKNKVYYFTMDELNLHEDYEKRCGKKLVGFNQEGDRFEIIVRTTGEDYNAMVQNRVCGRSEVYRAALTRYCGGVEPDSRGPEHPFSVFLKAWVCDKRPFLEVVESKNWYEVTPAA